MSIWNVVDEFTVQWYTKLDSNKSIGLEYEEIKE